MYNVLNCSPERSLVISLAAAALLFFRCQPRDLAFPFPERGSHGAGPSQGHWQWSQELPRPGGGPSALDLYPLLLPEPWPHLR